MVSKSATADFDAGVSKDGHTLRPVAVLRDGATRLPSSDRGLIRPMLDQLRRRSRSLPRRHLVDGGFNKNEDTEWAAAAGVNIYGPPTRNKHQTDPYAPRPGDREGVAAWRRRMKSPHGKAVYKRRSMGECINARFRQWGLHRLTVRGRDKANTVLHWFALANNILAGRRMLTAAV